MDGRSNQSRKSANLYTKDHFLSNEKLKIRGQEDCLYLNVYTPKVSSDSKLPVMVYFHGGGMEAGAGTSEFYGPTFLMDQDIVLVVTNYRLGPFGFLTTGDALVPGNEGLKDQVVALRWVRDNIKQFGGDPDLVTIFGESAGGSAVETHMISPLSKGLFHRAISQSGVSLSPWFLAPSSNTDKTRRLAAQLGCRVFNTKKLLECLRTKEANEIINALSIFHEWGNEPMFAFRAVIEPPEAGDIRFLTTHPKEVLTNPSEISSVPLMIGLTSEEGILKVAELLNKPHLLEDLQSNYQRYLPITLFYKYTSNKSNEISKRAKEFYFGDKDIGKETISSLINLYTDVWFTKSIDFSARAMASRPNGPVYYYYFKYVGDKSLTNFFGAPDLKLGVCHADELLYLFPYDHFIKDFVRSETDNEMIKFMTTLWTEFAKNGKPPSSLNWSPISSNPGLSDPLQYLEISNPNQTIERTGLLQERIDFWTSIDKLEKTRAKEEL